jgi:hypothetical protein
MTRIELQSDAIFGQFARPLNRAITNSRVGIAPTSL